MSAHLKPVAVTSSGSGYLDLGVHDQISRVEDAARRAHNELLMPAVQERVSQLGVFGMNARSAPYCKVDADGDHLSILTRAGTTLQTDLANDPVLCGPVFDLIREMDRGAQLALGLVRPWAGEALLSASSRVFIHPAGGPGLPSHRDGTFLTIIFRPAMDTSLEVWSDLTGRFERAKSVADRVGEGSAVLLSGDTTHRVVETRHQRIVMTVFIDKAAL